MSEPPECLCLVAKIFLKLLCTYPFLGLGIGEPQTQGHLDNLRAALLAHPSPGGPAKGELTQEILSRVLFVVSIFGEVINFLAHASESPCGNKRGPELAGEGWKEPLGPSLHPHPHSEDA